MSSTPSPSTTRATSLRAARAGAVVLVIGGALGCTAYSTAKTVPLDCTVTNAYEFKTIDPFTNASLAPMWTTHDCTAGAAMSANPVAIPDGARCQDTVALEIRASQNDDWGSLTGYNNFGPQNGSAYEGLSFWARALGSTTTGLQILLDDPNTANDNGVTPTIGNCMVEATADAGTCGTTQQVTITDPSTGMVLSSGAITAPPLPNECGNSYAYTLSVTNSWQLYTIPWSFFQQAQNPNKVPNAQLTQVGTAPGTFLITSQLLNLTLRMPKAADSDLWISELAFYRTKGSGPRDGGADAP